MKSTPANGTAEARASERRAWAQRAREPNIAACLASARTELLQDLRLDEVADADLAHDRDGHGALDLLDHLRVRHARHAAVAPDVRWHTLERHHRDGARLLGDARLLGVDDVHDDATLQHLSEAALHLPGARAVILDNVRRRVVALRHSSVRPRGAFPNVAEGFLRLRSEKSTPKKGEAM
jgi:hypothetical protein